MKFWIILLIIYATMPHTATVYAQENSKAPYDIIDQKVQKLAKDLYCIVCQGQNIAESDSFFAQDIRHMLYYKFALKQEEKEIITYLTERYGEAIYVFPSQKHYRRFLWYGPLILLVFGIGLILYYCREKPCEEGK